MKLIDRLKPIYKEAINIELEKYPYITQLIIDELETKEFYTQITFGIWSDLQAFTGARHPADIFLDNL